MFSKNTAKYMKKKEKDKSSYFSLNYFSLFKFKYIFYKLLLFINYDKSRLLKFKMIYPKSCHLVLINPVKKIINKYNVRILLVLKIHKRKFI